MRNKGVFAELYFNRDSILDEVGLVVRTLSALGRPSSMARL